MAEEILFQIRMDADLKNAAEKIYSNLGLNFSEAVRLFAKKVSRRVLYLLKFSQKKVRLARCQSTQIKI